MIDYLPGFDVDVDDERVDDVPVVPAPSSRNERPGKVEQLEIISSRNRATHFDAFAFRVRQFASGLSPQRSADVAARGRFYRLPWLRRSDETDSDDLP